MKRHITLFGIILLHWTQSGSVDNYTVYNKGNSIGSFPVSVVMRLADGSFTYPAPSGCNVGECQLQASYRGFDSGLSNLQPAPTPVNTPVPPILLGN